MLQEISKLQVSDGPQKGFSVFLCTMIWKLHKPTWNNEGVLENLTISLNHWLVPKKPKPKDTFWQRRKKRFQRRFSWTHIKKNWQLFVFMGFIFTVNVVLFVTRAVYFRWVSLWIIIEKEKKGSFMNRFKGGHFCGINKIRGKLDLFTYKYIQYLILIEYFALWEGDSFWARAALL